MISVLVFTRTPVLAELLQSDIPPAIAGKLNAVKDDLYIIELDSFFRHSFLIPV